MPLPALPTAPRAPGLEGPPASATVDNAEYPTYTWAGPKTLMNVVCLAANQVAV